MKSKLINSAGTLVAAMALVLQACQSGPDYKTVRKEVIDIHDKIMEDSERAISNKMKLDTLASSLKQFKAEKPELDTLAEKVQIAALVKQLNAADDEMNGWMHKFTADAEGKSNEEAVKYFEGEKVKVIKLDSLYTRLLSESGAYIRRFDLDPPAVKAAPHKHDMKM